MKQLFFTITIVSSILVSCSTGNKYEKLIADYVQTDKHGVWTDLSFKLIELEELPVITVSDSIAILKEKFEIGNTNYLQQQKTYLKNTEEGLAREERARFKMQPTIDMYKKHIQGAIQRIDSVKALEFVSD